MAVGVSLSACNSNTESDTAAKEAGADKVGLGNGPKSGTATRRTIKAGLVPHYFFGTPPSFEARREERLAPQDDVPASLLVSTDTKPVILGCEP